MNAQSKCDDLASPPQPAHHCSPAPRVALLGSGRDDAGLARKTLSELPPKKVKSSQIPARLGALSTEACIPLGALSTLRRASHWERSPHRGAHPTGSTLHTEVRIPLGALSTRRRVIPLRALSTLRRVIPQTPAPKWVLVNRGWER